MLSTTFAWTAEPWRLSSELDFPEWLDISGQNRIRYETLDGQFRLGRNGGDQLLAIRTTLKATVDWNSLQFAGELLDARQSLADRGTPLGTEDVNAVELLQAYVDWNADELLSDENQLSFRLGRQTKDLGSRRLVARNGFRNTINAFTGLGGNWEDASGVSIQAFYFLPITRRPVDFESLLDNDIEFDEEDFDLQFFGIFAEKPDLLFGATGEAYLLGLYENDSAMQPTRDRRLWTPGLRFHRAAAPAAFDFEIESTVQFGKSRSSILPMDTEDLDHFAHMHHVEVGYTFNLDWKPSVSVLYDYASGDDNPMDGDHNRFDTLYGARGFEHGPTGIHGAFARSNIQSPSYRIRLNPHENLDLKFAHRLYWLASDTDA